MSWRDPYLKALFLCCHDFCWFKKFTSLFLWSNENQLWTSQYGRQYKAGRRGWQTRWLCCHLEVPGQVRELDREEFNYLPKVWDASSWNTIFSFWGAVDLDYLLVCLKTLCGSLSNFSLITYNDISTIVCNVGEPTEIHYVRICSKYVLCCFPVMNRSSVYEHGSMVFGIFIKLKLTSCLTD